MIRLIEENSITDITIAISGELGLDYQLYGSKMAEITMPDGSITTLKDENGDIVWNPEYGSGYSRLHFNDYDSLSDFIDDIEYEVRDSKLEAANIKAKNEGILEVPEGKKVYDLPVSHFKDLIDRKGREAIIRAITNLEVWNKNDDPKISKWAKDMKKSLGDYGEKK